jgi:hypothetical protein
MSTCVFHEGSVFDYSYSIYMTYSFCTKMEEARAVYAYGIWHMSCIAEAPKCLIIKIYKNEDDSIDVFISDTCVK